MAGLGDVNSFSSPRDACIRGNADADDKFPCDNLSDEADLGHDLFYGRNDTGKIVLSQARMDPNR